MWSSGEESALFTDEGTGSIPGQGTKVRCHKLHSLSKKKKEKQLHLVSDNTNDLLPSDLKSMSKSVLLKKILKIYYLVKAIQFKLLPDPVRIY